MHHTNIMNMTKNMSDDEFKDLVKEVYYLKRKYESHVVPYKLKETRKDRYEFYLHCPYCNQKSYYRNFLFKNKYYFSAFTLCRNKNCYKRLFVGSKLYKFTVDNYLALDFLRKNYLYFRDMLLRKKLV